MVILFILILHLMVLSNLEQLAHCHDQQGLDVSNKRDNNEMSKYLTELALKSFSPKLMLEMDDDLKANGGIQFPNISEECVNSFKSVVADLKNPKMFEDVRDSRLAKMLDSLPKPPSGILTGNMFWLGNFQQCIEINSPNTSTTEQFIGEYCLASLHSEKVDSIQILKKKGIDPRLKFGTCFPSTCSFQDKYLLLNYTFGPLGNAVEIELKKENCQTKHKQPMDVVTVIFMLILLTFVLLVLLATIVDLEKRRSTTDSNANIDKSDDGQDTSILLSFSAIRSFKSIFEIKNNKSEIGAINGIRAISIMLVITGHSILHCQLSYPWRNHLDVLKTFDYFFYQPFLFSASYSVNSFFAISGFLVTYIFMEMSQAQNKAPNIFGYYLFRYMRLTPPMIIILLFLSGPFYYMNQGPIWPSVYESDVKACRKLWWKSVLYIQNYVEKDQICFREGWYLSADTQLFCLSPMILYPLFKKPVLGVMLMGLCFAITTILTMSLIGVSGQPTFVGKNTLKSESASYLNNFYRQSYYEAPTYIIGMAFGYILHYIQKKRIKLSKKLIVSSWICSTAILLSLLFGTYYFNTGYSTMSPWINVFYGSLGRPAWALANAWIILACALGHGGLINDILTNQIFIIMGRLTFGAYLAHGSVLTYYYFGQKDGLYFTEYNMTVEIVGNIVISMMAAVVLNVVIEMPLIDLLKKLGNKSEEMKKIKSALTDSRNQRQCEQHTLLVNDFSQDEEIYEKN